MKNMKSNIRKKINEKKIKETSLAVEIKKTIIVTGTSSKRKSRGVSTSVAHQSNSQRYRS